MIQAKNVTKIYKPKSGQSVAALNGVSLTLPDRGMVFILGKSGSGKSTLLNLLGGLDRPTSGEIIVNGENILNSGNRLLDSYRNTYVGFIFQEYNLLPEFTVGANIALAIELQGRRATDGEINGILREVDLDGYGARRPNELSGGQLQRVAIARALVKNPDIIMADEPTGALDSATGRAVFDTLKKLSREKLVLIVSHDREFSERYADRIISLADGAIVGDDELTPESVSEESAPIYGENGVEIPAGYVLTEDDLRMINDYLRGMETGSYRVSASRQNRRFRPSRESAAAPEKSFKLIKSRLPAAVAAKIGGYSMRIKPFRLVMTVLLSVVAFTLFGLSFIMGSYDKISTGTASIADNGIGYVAYTKERRNGMTDVIDAMMWDELQGAVTKRDFAVIKEKTGVDVTGVYNDGGAYYILSLGKEGYDYGSFTSKYTSSLTGLCGMTSEQLDKLGYTFVAGGYPRDDGEIAIPLYVAESFMKFGYTDGKTTTVPADAGWLVGKEISVLDGSVGFSFTVSGVIDTKFDSSRFDILSKDVSELSEKDSVSMFIKMLRLQYAQNYSLCSVGFCRPEFIDKLTGGPQTLRHVSGSVFLRNGDYSRYAEIRMIDRRSALGNDDFVRIGSENGCVIDMSVYLTLVQDEFGIDLGSKASEIRRLVGSIPRDELETLLSDLIKEANRNGVNLWDSDLTLDIKSSYNAEKTLKIRVEGVALTSGGVIYCPDNVYEAIPSVEKGFAFAVGVMPDSRSEISDLLKLTYNEKGEYRYALKNEVTEIIGNLDDIFSALSSVFVSVGIVFAVFASLLFSNFIAQSILHKKMQIGILRAIGARSLDVFAIFFSESFFIAMINFVISCASTFFISLAINNVVRSRFDFAVTVLPFGFGTAAVIFAISIAAAFAASFLPVYRIARKKPVDAIRNR